MNRSSLSICRFQVLGDRPKVEDQEFVDEIVQFSVEKAVFTKEKLGRAGWCGPQHLFDDDFAIENIYHEPYLTLGLRVDKKKVPGVLYRGLCMREEAAFRREADVERVSPKKRREIRDQIREQLIAETPTSYHVVDWYWNVVTGNLGIATFSKGVLEVFTELFERTFERELEPVNPYTLACRLVSEADLERLVALEPADFLSE